MTSVARLGRKRLSRGVQGLVVGRGEVEVGPVARLVREVPLALDHRFQADKLALKIAVAAYGRFRADTDKLFDQDRAVTKLAGLFPLIPAIGIDIDVMKFRKRGLAVVEFVGCDRCADLDPLAIARGPLELTVGKLEVFFRRGGGHKPR